ncbi:MAG: N-acetyl-gamma-glutamyl-phosphate reductase [Aquifex sp.]|nr:MAG: N-acetyl-gamma-glutamyl-phosphate reductase [Aquifex sp.]
MEQTLRVSIFGATGYTGIELLRSLLIHPFVEIKNLVSQSYKGQKVGEVLPSFSVTYISDIEFVEEPREDYDVAFLCLPHEVSYKLVPKLLEDGKKVIDLSGAYRIRNAEVYEEFYGFKHENRELLEKAVYGLPEIFRKDIKQSQLIANPGCYPTATLLGLYPFIKEGIEFDEIIVHALSGISGAGRKPKQHFHFPEMTENFFNYSVEKHRHTPEMEDVIRRINGREIKVRFTPTVVPVSRGMISTIYLKAEKVDVKELFKEVYKEEIFIKVIDKHPHTKWVLGTNYCFIYPYYDERTDTYVIISSIDNLGKGASLQAVQNMNIMFGLDEDEGLLQTPIFP